MLVFHDQPLSDEQQLAFTRSLGEIEHAIGTSLRAADEYRLPTTFADVSNLDENNQVYARDRPLGGSTRSATGSGTPTARSRWSPRSTRCCTRARVPSKGGNTEFADMRAGYDALDRRDPRPRCRTSICEHSQVYSRAAAAGSPTSPTEERARFAPVRQVPGAHPSRSPGASRSTSPRTRAGSWAGRCRRRAPSCATSSRSPPSASSSTRTAGECGDLVMWDNRRTMHRARPFPGHEPRDVRRTTLMGDGPTAARSRVESPSSRACPGSAPPSRASRCR